MRHIPNVSNSSVFPASCMTSQPIVPIILAAGGSHGLSFPKPLARFGPRTALEIAVANCAGLERPIVVLGSDAIRVRPLVPRRALVVTNRRWRSGQLSSLLCALRHVPSGAAILLYPVDHPLLARSILHRLARAFWSRRQHQRIVMPRYLNRPGHPVIFAPEVFPEFKTAKTAREVTYRDPARIRYVRVNNPAVSTDFRSPETYRACLAKYEAARARRATRPPRRKISVRTSGRRE